MRNIVHMSGAGNTFLVADGRDMKEVIPPDDLKRLIIDHPRSDAQRIEGVLILRSVVDATIVADFYNPDGSHGMMCGNGARCIVRYACDNGLEVSNNITLILNGTQYACALFQDATVGITFDAPKEIRHYPIGSLGGVDEDVWYINVGSDHVVIGGPLDAGRPVVHALRHHPAFPRGVNVNMRTSNDILHLATFERGVEAVTGACGTGALSAAIIEWVRNPERTTCVIIPPSGRPLQTTLTIEQSTIVSMTLRGDAVYDNA